MTTQELAVSHPKVAQHFVTGVAVATAGRAETAYGVTVSTFTLVSHRPPIVSMALREGARSLAAFDRQGGFSVSVLAADQSWLARYFADPRRPLGVGALDPDAWLPGEHGPLLRGAIGWLDCRLDRSIPAGDHQLLLGRVDSADLRPGRPLVNFAGALHTDLWTRGPDDD